MTHISSPCEKKTGRQRGVDRKTTVRDPRNECSGNYGHFSAGGIKKIYRATEPGAGGPPVDAEAYAWRTGALELAAFTKDIINPRHREKERNMPASPFFLPSVSFQGFSLARTSQEPGDRGAWKSIHHHYPMHWTGEGRKQAQVQPRGWC